MIAMKKSFFRFLALIIVCFAALSFQSCSDDKYTVWTDTETYSQFVNETGTTLNDGNYIKVEIANANWEEMAKSLTNEGKHRWDEATIKNGSLVMALARQKRVVSPLG